MSNSIGPDSPLVAAARAGDLPLLRELMNPEQTSGEDAKDAVSLGYALLAAIQGGHVAGAEYLLEHGAEARANSMVRAVQYEAPDEMLAALIRHGVDVNGTTSTGLPILDTALGHARPLRFLLEHGADPDQMYARWRMRPLDYAASFHTPQDLQTLLSYGARLDEASPLHAAAAANTEKDRVPVMKYLLDECSIDVNAISTFGHRMSKRRGDEDGPPLHAAVRGGHPDRVAYLLRRGADPQAKSTRGDNVFEFCKRNGLDDRLQMLEQVLAEQTADTHRKVAGDNS